jgi:hypothetical protein
MLIWIWKGSLFFAETHCRNTKSVFVPIIIYIGTFKATPIANQPNNLMGRQNLFLIDMSASDDIIHCTLSEIVLSQNRKTI